MYESILNKNRNNNNNNNRNTAHVECQSRSDTDNNRAVWNHVKVIQKIPEQYTGKVRNQGNVEKRHTGHCTHTAGSADVKVQNIQRRK